MRSPLPTLAAGTFLLGSALFVVPRLGGPPSWALFYLLHELPGEVKFAALLLPAPLALLLHGPLRRPASALARLGARVPLWLLPWLAGGLAFVVFWIFRESRHWGDADMTVAILEGRAPVPALGRWFWREPLDRLLAISTTAVFARAGVGAEAAVAFLSCAAGGVFAGLLVPLSRLLAERPGSRVFVWCFVLSMGASQLFFGHVENYTLVTTALLAFFLASARILDGRGGLWTAWLLAAIAVATHVQAVVLIAPLITLLAVSRPAARLTLRELLLSALPGIAFLLCLYTVCRGLGAPPIEVAANRYAGQAGVVLGLDQALRGRHLWNVLQGYVLTLPFGAFPILLAGCAPRAWTDWRDPLARVLAAGCLGFGAFNLFFDAQLARRMDWSLFAPAALPVALLAARLMARRLDDGRSSPLAASFLVLLSLAVSGPWVASNHLADSQPALAAARPCTPGDQSGLWGASSGARRAASALHSIEGSRPSTCRVL